MGKGGMRELQEEKTLLSELGKLFHITRANAREQRIKQQVAKTTSTNTVKETSNSPQKEGTRKQQQQTQKQQTQQKQSKRSRKSTRGGTVWVVLKGGFARVPTEANGAVISHNKNFRGRLSEKRRLEALEAAEQYVQTAWQQAQEAGLLVEDGSAPSGEEGLQYLREQYAVAAGMLRREAIGSRLKQMVDQTIPSGLTNAASSHVETTTTTNTTVYDKDKWAEIIARENVILNRFADSAAVKDDGEVIHHEAAEVGSKYYFNTFEPLAAESVGSKDTSTGHASGNSDALRGEQVRDVLPTKCIVRIRGSGKQKHTSIICTTKAVNYFKSNFMQIIRKELGNSKLPRGEETVENKQQQQQQQPQQRGNNSPSENIASGSSKNAGKKRQK